MLLIKNSSATTTSKIRLIVRASMHTRPSVGIHPGAGAPPAGSKVQLDEVKKIVNKPWVTSDPKPKAAEIEPAAKTTESAQSSAADSCVKSVEGYGEEEKKIEEKVPFETINKTRLKELELKYTELYDMPQPPAKNAFHLYLLDHAYKQNATEKGREFHARMNDVYKALPAEEKEQYVERLKKAREEYQTVMKEWTEKMNAAEGKGDEIQLVIKHSAELAEKPLREYTRAMKSEVASSASAKVAAFKPPKKPMAAHRFYMDKMYDSFVAQNPRMNKVDCRDKLRNQFELLSDDEKLEFMKLAEDDVTRYNAEFDELPEDVKESIEKEKQKQADFKQQQAELRIKFKAPFKPETPYAKFLNENIAERSDGETTGHFAARMAPKWDLLSEEEKQIKKDKYVEDKAAYVNQFESWKTKMKNEGHVDELTIILSPKPI